MINRITNNERLSELYSCEQCNGSGKYQGGEMRQCNDCNGLGFILDKDSQTLSIIGELIRAQECLKAGFSSTINPEMKFTGLLLAEDHLPKAFIKLVELIYSENKVEINLGSITAKQASPQKSSLLLNLDLDKGVLEIIDFVILNPSISLESLITFCQHRKIDIHDYVKSILDKEEKYSS